MATETQTQIAREAPEIEAYKLGLLERIEISFLVKQLK